MIVFFRLTFIDDCVIGLFLLQSYNLPNCGRRLALVTVAYCLERKSLPVDDDIIDHRSWSDDGQGYYF
jgi:hypothetical protein